MSQFKKVLEKILSGLQDNSIHFVSLCNLLKKLGFYERIKGSHHIYYKKNVDEIINIQPDGNLAKSYQVKQVRNIILKYRLGEIDD